MVISTSKNQTKIETIEPDSFISTAFVENILLQNIATKALHTNTFRGLSHCNFLDLSNSFIESIENFTFYGTKNINYLNLSNCGIRSINNDSFKETYRLKNINLEGNYLSNVSEEVYFDLILDFINNTAEKTVDLEKISNKRNEVLLNFDRNPIKCDCNLKWLFKNKTFFNYIKLPRVCSGPKGYDCLTISELNINNLATCSNESMSQNLPCEEREYLNKINNHNDESYDESLNDDESYEELYNGTLVKQTSTSKKTTTTTVSTTIISKRFQHISKFTPTFSYHNPKASTISSSKSKVAPGKSISNRLLHNAKILFLFFSLLFFFNLNDLY